MDHFRIQKESITCFYGDILFIHGKIPNKRRAFLINESRSMLLRIPRIYGVLDSFFEYNADGEQKIIPFKFHAFSHAEDELLASLSTLKVGLYFGRIHLKTALGDFYGVSQNGRIFFSREIDPHGTVQISVSSFSSRNNTYLGGAIYHIFVDRFAKGKRKVEKKPGAIVVEDWSKGIPEYPEYPGAHLENNTFYGGTLYGVAEKMDYFVSLGVSLLYLSPIFEAYSNHKYDTADYMTVDRMFGGERALRHLIKEAEKRGIGILLDGVFNHTGSDSIYFNKNGTYPSLGAYQSTESPYYSWYEFSKHPDSYECWWGIPILPRIHPDRYACGEFFLGDKGVIKKYMDMGIAGFRLDVADELSDHFISGIKKRLLETNRNALLYGEVWEDASNKIAYGVRKKYYLGKELDGVMNYPLRTALIAYFKDQSTDALDFYINEIFANMPKHVADAQMNLLGTHDTIRILTALGGESPEGYSTEALSKKKMTSEQYEHGKKVLKMLYTVIATLPGLPTIYYGDEVGLEGYADPFNRLPYPHGNEDVDLLSHYRQIGMLRKRHSVYKKGDFALLSLTKEHFIFMRRARSSAYITVANQSDEVLALSFEAPAVDLLSGKSSTELCVMPQTATVIRTSKNFKLKIK